MREWEEVKLESAVGVINSSSCTNHFIIHHQQYQQQQQHPPPTTPIRNGRLDNDGRRVEGRG